MAEPLGQKVVILKGGFERFNTIGGDLGKCNVNLFLRDSTKRSYPVVVPRDA